MRVIVCGSRRWHDRERITNRLCDLPGDSVIVHGAAKGADRIAHQESLKLGLLDTDLLRLVADMAAELHSLYHSPGEINYMPSIPPLLLRVQQLEDTT